MGSQSAQSLFHTHARIGRPPNGTNPILSDPPVTGRWSGSSSIIRQVLTCADVSGALTCLMSCVLLLLSWVCSVTDMGWGQCGWSESWDPANGQVAPLCHDASGHGFLWYPGNGSTRGQLGCRLVDFLASTPETVVWERDKWHSKDSQQRFIQHQRRLSGVASKGWVPWLCSGYLLYIINFPLKQLRSLHSPGSSSSAVVRSIKITDREAVMDEQKLLTQDKRRESKRLLTLIGGFDLTLTSKQHLR